MQRLLGIGLLLAVLALVLWFFMSGDSDSKPGVKDEPIPPDVQETVTEPPQEEEKKELLLEIHPLPSEDKSRFDADLITLGEETYRIGADEPESQVLQVCQTIIEALQKREVQSIDVPAGGTQRVRQRLIKELKKNGIAVRDLEDVDTDAGAGTGSGTDANTATETDAGAEASTDSNAATGADASVEANAGSSTNAGASAGTDASTEQNQK